MLTRVLVGGLLALLGLAVTTGVQVRSDDRAFATYREQDLITLVDGLDGSIRRNRADLDRLRSTGDGLRTDLAEDRLGADQAAERTAPLEVLAGLQPVRGPGLRITVADPGGAVGFDLVLDLVEDLRGAGADAVEINDRARLGADSWISGLGGGINVDGIALERPYVIEVVGTPTTLAGALGFPRGGADRMRRAGAEVAYEQDTVEVISVRTLPDLPNAQPVGPVL